MQTPTPTQSPQTKLISSDIYDGSEPPRRFKAVKDVYNDTEPFELDDELNLMGIEEHTNFKQANKEKEWKRAMAQEMESIKKIICGI